MAELQKESGAMRFLKAVGLEGMSWALRRLYCPVHKDDLVLEVGSGGNPYARANVLLDAYEATRERHWVPLKVDRPMVLGFVEKLPFRDKAFDFVIASHVLEHSAYPARFLAELQRVGKAGYIEVPDAFLERINPYRDHRLEITERHGRLMIRKKPAWVVEHDTVDLYEKRVKPLLTNELIPRHPFAFHVRYYWEKTIDYEILNPQEEVNWETPVFEHALPGLESINLSAHMKGKLLDILRKLFSQTNRNQYIDLLTLLACPQCNSESLKRIPDHLFCNDCGETYLVRNSIPVMVNKAWRYNTEEFFS